MDGRNGALLGACGLVAVLLIAALGGMAHGDA